MVFKSIPAIVDDPRPKSSSSSSSSSSTRVDDAITEDRNEEGGGGDGGGTRSTELCSSYPVASELPLGTRMPLED
ncbi:hypothetical protein RRF57_010828 [Xylaria bambusicola]|uniref:Uncharacterized protein n=1 Tax=Xylaria bambusicola TaxID=326684 RepID=A0AAN7UXN7_9PEZI